MDEDYEQADVLTSDCHDSDVTCGVSSSDFADFVAVSNCSDENETIHNLSSHETVSGLPTPISVDQHDQCTMPDGPGDVIQSGSVSGSVVGTVIDGQSFASADVDGKFTENGFDQNTDTTCDGPSQFAGNDVENRVRSSPTLAGDSTVDVDGDQLTTSGVPDENGTAAAAAAATTDDNEEEEHFHLSANSESAATDEPEVNSPKIDFTAGIRCSDVPSALDILNTRYRLADVTIHKNMITWSSWNIGDIVRGPHRESFCWVGKRRGCYAATLPSRCHPSPDGGFVSKSQENEAKQDGVDGKIKDMESLCEKIELKEKEIERMLQRDEQRQRDSAAVYHVTNEEPVTMDTAPLTSAAAPPGGENQKRRENIFQRLIRALRQRFSRQPQECHDQGQSCDTLDRNACRRSKQRTL